MAETKETKTAAKKDDRVELFIPRGNSQDEPYVIISVNGVNYKLPKGEASLVPQHIKDEWDRAQKAQARYDKTVDRLKDAANAAANK